MSGTGTAEDPWVLKTPPGTSGRFAMYIPLLGELGLVELEHDARNDRIRGI